MSVLGFAGIVPIPDDEKDKERTNFRAVPDSDCGNEAYTDRGALGSYTPAERPYPAPADVKFFEGYGADKSDLDRGYLEPSIREDPAYDLENYRDRSSLPRVPDEDLGNPYAMRDDWEFRSRNMRSRGFLPRPRLPSGRG